MHLLTNPVGARVLLLYHAYSHHPLASLNIGMQVSYISGQYYRAVCLIQKPLVAPLRTSGPSVVPSFELTKTDSIPLAIEMNLGKTNKERQRPSYAIFLWAVFGASCFFYLGRLSAAHIVASPEPQCKSVLA